MQKIIALALLLAGGAGSYFMLVRPATNVVRARFWTPTECEITRSQVTSSRSSSSNEDRSTYGIDLAYRYVVGRREYQSARYSFLDGMSSSGYAKKARIVEKYDTGSIVACYVNPDAPGEAVLNRGITAEMLLGLIPLLLVAFGILALGVLPPLGGDSVRRWVATVQGRRIGDSRPPTEAARVVASPPMPRELLQGLVAALVLVGIGVFDLLASIGDEVTHVPSLLIHLAVLAVLTFGYYRRSILAALALLAYPLCLLLVRLTVDAERMRALWVWLLVSLPGPVVVRLVQMPDVVPALLVYAREAAPFTILAVPIAYALFHGARHLIREAGGDPRPAFGAAALAPVFLLALVLASVAAEYQASQPVAELAPEAIASALTGSDDARRLAACQQGQRGMAVPPELVPALLAAAGATDPSVRGTCLSVLGQAGAAGREAIPTLTAALADPSSYVRLVAAETLGEIAAAVGGAEAAAAVDALVPLAADADGQVRRFVLGALQRLGADSPAALEAYGRALEDAEVDVRQNALRALAVAGPATAAQVPAVMKALRHENELTRQAAAETLGAIGAGTKGVGDELAGVALGDSAGHVRETAVKALVRVAPHGNDLPQLLARCLKDSEMTVRGAAIVALTETGPKAAPAVPELIRILSGKEIYLRVWAVEALGAIGPGAKAALPRLREMLTETLITKESEALQIPTVVPAAIAAIEGSH